MDGIGRKTGAEKAGRNTPPPLPRSEQRFAPRRRDKLPAFIYFEGGNQSLDCFVRDLSSTGARLEMGEGWDEAFSSSVRRLDQARLVIRHDRVIYDCLITRRGDAEIGVKFLSAAKPFANGR
jgi:hypothetical protein